MPLAFLFYLLCAITDCPPPVVHQSGSNNAVPRFSLLQDFLSTSANTIIPVSATANRENRFARSNNLHDDDAAPLVSTKLGDIQGRFIKSRNGRKIAAFEGIKYGMAPVGNRRFRNPVPFPPWNGQLMIANKTAMDCLQLDFSRLMQVRGAEDCLALNVYSNHKSVLKTRSKSPQKNPLPVIVFLHGGGWMSHSGSNYGPNYLLDKDIIFVTVNFRLGILGFLSTGDKAARGNFGLHDQSLALKWIYDNIAAFGGNPSKITLMGESTGAGSVALHLQSPITARVLPNIHGAILLSGSSLNHWGIMNDTISNSKRLARRMNCPTGNSQDIVACLCRADPYMVVGQQMHLWTVPVISRLLFGPVIESATDNPTAFITESPLVAYTQHPQTIRPVPIMTGFNQNEGGLFAANVDLVPFLYRSINTQWDKMAGYLMAYDKLPGVNMHETSQKIAKFYFNNKRWSFNNRDQISNVLGDRTITTGVYKFLQHHSRLASSYGYFFTYFSKSSSSLLKQVGLRSQDWGVSHGDELPFIFSMNRMFDGDFENEKDMAISKWLVDVVTNFAYDRQPFPNNEVIENVTWSPILNPKYMELLEVNEKKRMIPFPNMKRIKFWESLNLN